MPEFPEVNIQVQYLRQRVEGLDIAAFGYTGYGHFKNLPEANRPALVEDFFAGNRLHRVFQRGKRVVLATPRGTVASHLMFKGRWSVAGDPFVSNYRHHIEPPTDRSVTFHLELSSGLRLNFHAPEWKARITVHPGEAPDEVAELTKLGPEVLATPETAPGFDYPAWELGPFERAAGRSRQAIKAFLLDQKKISGIGNMYACEALYRAQIAPDRPAKSLGPDEVARLYDAVQDIMRQAIESQLDYDALLQIYKRDTDPSGREVQITKISGRDTHWVPEVQR